MSEQLLITDVTVNAVIVPMDPPHRTASGEIAVSPLVLVDLHAGGVVGHSIAFAYTPAALKPLADLILNLKPLLINQPLAPYTLYDQLQARFRIMGTQGLVGVALAAFDMACWDALAKHYNKPLYRFLGGSPNVVQAYANVGFDGPAECARQAESFAKRGFKAIKAKIGYATVQDDIAVIEAMRQAVGPDVELMVDYNQSLDPVTAIETIDKLKDLGLSWVEEPVLAHDHQSCARVRQAVNTPIQGGENWWGPLDMQQALAAQATDYVMPDVQKIARAYPAICGQKLVRICWQ